MNGLVSCQIFALGFNDLGVLGEGFSNGYLGLRWRKSRCKIWHKVTKKLPDTVSGGGGYGVHLGSSCTVARHGVDNAAPCLA